MVNGVFSIPSPEFYPRDDGPWNEGPRNNDPWSVSTLPIRAYVGDAANQGVHSATQLLLSSDARFNPVMVYGPSGTGKTTYCRSLSQMWDQLNSESPALYFAGSDFAREFAEAVDGRHIEEFRKRLRIAGLLIIDGLDQLANRAAAQQELIVGLDWRLQHDANSLVASPQSAAKTHGLLPQLASRLSGGLSVPMTSPGPAARSLLVDQFADERSVQFSNDAKRRILDWIASEEQLPTVPTIHQLLHRVTQSTSPDAAALISVEDVESALGGGNHHTVSLATIAGEVATAYGVTVRELRSSTRRQPVVRARSTAMYLTRKITRNSLQEVGRYYGNRDHTTVIHACRKVENLMATDLATRNLVTELSRRMKQQGQLETIS